MDPNAALKEILEAMRNGHIQEQYDAVENLFLWLSRGGIAPDRNKLSEDEWRELLDRLLATALHTLHPSSF